MESPITTDLAARAVRATKIYGSGDTAVTAIDSVDLDVKGAELVSIMGPSGSGKSTLMHVMAGLDRLTSGTVYVGGQELGDLDDDDLTRLRRDRIGFVFQAFNLIPTLTARENIVLPTRIARRTVDNAWADQVIGTLGLDNRLEHRPTELSGGQQQRVAAARALVGRPEIVFADEPSGNLDTTSSGELLEFLRRAVDEFHQTIVMVTHDPSAAAYSDRVIFLRDGAVVGELADPETDSILEALKTLEHS
ncbi:MAG: ATP-binding cassette domain-containing protein [Acidimicrobiia bacterium]|nr:ATP-binding cassette domain-containing protein [Acidimicrobiia bacterium]